MVRKMRDENKTLNGDEIDGKTSFFIGAAANPFADPFEIRALRLAKKINAGVEFIQTQCIYDLDKFERWMEIVRKMGLHRKAFILGGVTPLKSVGMARYMKSSVSGIDIPDEVINRLKSVPKEEVSKEGIEICVETIERLKKIEGVAGVHLMAIEWEKKVPEIVEKAGLLPRPIP
jgi:methylenetetrahydrofolate reductase (NADPH)